MTTDYTWVHAIIWPVLNALLGIILIEYCWARTRPIREIDEARDSKYPAFRRYDAVKWSRWKFYPGAVTFMFPRLFIMFFNLFLCWVFTLIITLGSNIENQPIRGCRKRIINCLYWTQAKLEGIFYFYRTSYKKVDFDYSYYLGEDYKKTQQLPARISTFVSNHASWYDPLLLHACLGCGFAAKKELKNTPIAGVIAKALGCIFISRGGSPEELQKIVEDIQERQNLIE
jgi:1-acyl-sn-glycerol-3-phosphate acyltransferase